MYPRYVVKRQVRGVLEVVQTEHEKRRFSWRRFQNSLLEMFFNFIKSLSEDGLLGLGKAGAGRNCIIVGVHRTM